MADTFQFELVSPEKLILSQPVIMVTVPGAEGDYGVLAGHAPLITAVRPGVIGIYDKDDIVPMEKLFVAGGFAEVTGDRCTVLAEKVEKVEDLHAPTIENEVKELIAHIEAAKNDEQRAEFEKRLEVAKAKLVAASQPN